MAKMVRPESLRMRDNQIVDCLALHFRVHESTILEWLLSFDHDAASARVMEEFL